MRPVAAYVQAVIVLAAIGGLSWWLWPPSSPAAVGIAVWLDANLGRRKR